eukprot:GFUD01013259.1.p1 GENE.GFUD01013259.1~~GFUD01013259.1.p1  ORF type:complete len:314 (+),score=82.24 GFUD01013259.1:50-991(+)
MEKISVVDISLIGLQNEDPTEEEFEMVGTKMGLAFSKIGFVFLTGHGIGDGVIGDAMEVSKEFFEMEEDKKHKISRATPTARDGWVSTGRETFKEENEAKVHEFREAFDINGFGEDARFPENPAEFKANLMDLAEKSVILAQRLLTCISLALGKPANFLSDLHSRILGGKNASALRSLYYPAIQGIPPEGYVRCSEHTDYGTFTILFQDQYPGLEVKSTSGSWVSADPIPGTILVNIGDLLEMWTGGRYPATKHRVIIPEEEIKKSAPRQSIVFFVHPDNQVVVKSLDDSTNDYVAVVALDHVQKRFSETYIY